MCIAVIGKPGCDVMGFEVNQAIFSKWSKSHGKNLNVLRTKRAFKMKSKTSFIIFKGLSIKQITQNFLEGESPTLSIF